MPAIAVPNTSIPDDPPPDVCNVPELTIALLTVVADVLPPEMVRDPVAMADDKSPVVVISP